MIKEKTIICKTFDEYSDVEQENIINKYRDINIEYINNLVDYDETLLIDLNEQGFNVTDKDIFYDLSYCQGSGACFDCNSFDIEKLLANYDGKHKNFMIDIIKNYCELYIKENNLARYYSHSGTRSIELYLVNYGNYARIENELNDIKNYLENLRYNASEKLYEDLQKDYDYLTSAECVEDTLLANEYFFNSVTYEIE